MSDDLQAQQIADLKAQLDAIKRQHVEAGKIGGKVRASKLSPEKRAKIARKGGLAKQVKRMMRECQG